MSPRRMAAGHARAARAILALAAASACLGAVAYAATRPEAPGQGLAGNEPVAVAPQQPHGTDAAPGKGAPGKGEEALPRARLIEYPEAVSTAAEAQFRFHVPPRSEPIPQPSPGPPSEVAPTRHFQCKIDGGSWRICSSPYRLTGLALDAHTFAVRALARADRPGPANSYSWRQAAASPTPQQVESEVDPEVAPKPFSIELRGELEDLYPGYPPQQLAIVVDNPNPVPIEVTSLSVAIAGDAPNCAAENFALTPSSASPRAPLIVPAEASVSLPTEAASAPTISMLNLPVNQDACQGADVPLVFDGEAHG